MNKRKSSTEMFPLVAAWESSPENQIDFCKSRDISPSVFAYWRKKYATAQRDQPSCFTEVLPALDSKIEVCYPNGVRVQLPERSSLATLQALIRLS